MYGCSLESLAEIAPQGAKCEVGQDDPTMAVVWSTFLGDFSDFTMLGIFWGSSLVFSWVFPGWHDRTWKQTWKL